VRRPLPGYAEGCHWHHGRYRGAMGGFPLLRTTVSGFDWHPLKVI